MEGAGDVRVSAVLIAIVLQTLTLGTVWFAAIHGLRQDLRDLRNDLRCRAQARGTGLCGETRTTSR